MIGHAFVVGAHAVAHGNAMGLGMAHVDVFVARAHGADQASSGMRCICAADRPVAPIVHTLHAHAVFGNGSLGLIGLGCIDHFKVWKGLRHLQQMGGDLEIQNEQGWLHGDSADEHGYSPPTA